jgi:hypothetical protein
MGNVIRLRPAVAGLRRDKSVIRHGESALPTAGLVIRD